MGVLDSWLIMPESGPAYERSSHMEVGLNSSKSLNKRKEERKRKYTLFECLFNVFSTKVIIRDTILTSPTGDGTAILRGHPRHAKVKPLRQHLQFSVIFLKTLSIGRSRESNPRPPALQSSALPTELILSWTKCEQGYSNS